MIVVLYFFVFSIHGASALLTSFCVFNSSARQRKGSITTKDGLFEGLEKSSLIIFLSIDDWFIISNSSFISISFESVPKRVITSWHSSQFINNARLGASSR